MLTTLLKQLFLLQPYMNRCKHHRRTQSLTHSVTTTIYVKISSMSTVC